MCHKHFSEEYSIMLADRMFSSKTDLSIWIKNLLKSTVTPYKLPEELKVQIADLVNYHPRAQEKIGSGIKEIWIERNGSLLSGNRFIIVRTDGSHCDFSYKYCLGKDLPSHPQRVREAMRNTIRPYIMEYKEKYFIINKDYQGYAPCELSHKKMLPNHAEVDHIEPYTFENLVQKFLGEYKLKFRNITLISENQKSPLNLADSDIKQKWIEFHNQKCHLRVIDREIHRGVSMSFISSP